MFKGVCILTVLVFETLFVSAAVLELCTQSFVTGAEE